MPALIINPADGVFIADLFGFILALPISLFLVYWMSTVKRRSAVVIGAFIGALLGFLIIYGWAGTLIFPTDLPNVQPAAVFFGSIVFCATLGLVGGMLVDLLVARGSRRNHQSAIAHE